MRLKLRHGWVIISYMKQWIWLLIHAQNSVKWCYQRVSKYVNTANKRCTNHLKHFSPAWCFVVTVTIIKIYATPANLLLQLYGTPTAWFQTEWLHEMETFSALLAICAGNSPVTGEFPTQRPVTQSFDVFFDLCLNKRLSKQSWGWWFETPSRSLWRHCNVLIWHAPFENVDSKTLT